jgi:phage tail-like protein
MSPSITCLRHCHSAEVESTRRNGSVVIKDSQHNEVARWNFEHGWPSKYSGADLDAGGNDIAAEKLVITHEGLIRT